MNKKTVTPEQGHFKKLRRIGKTFQSISKHRKIYKKAINGVCEVIVYKWNQSLQRDKGE